MERFNNPLDNIRIASPCSQDWDSMIGNDRRRYCGECKLNVYNLSGMTRDEAESLIIGAEGRLCVRFYKRPDGSVLTMDCPVGWKAVKRKMSRMATAAVSLLFGLLSGIGLVSLSESRAVRQLISIKPLERQPEVMGAVAYRPEVVNPEVRRNRRYSPTAVGESR